MGKLAENFNLGEHVLPPQMPPPPERRYVARAPALGNMEPHLEFECDLVFVQRLL